jgi:hypothetical protein
MEEKDAMSPGKEKMTTEMDGGDARFRPSQLLRPKTFTFPNLYCFDEFEKNTTKKNYRLTQYVYKIF